MRPPLLLQAAVVALALLPAAGVLLAGGGPFAAAVALALGPLAAGGGWALAHRTIAERLEALGGAAEAVAAGDASARERLRRGGLGRAGRGLDALALRVEELSARDALLEASGEAIVALDGAGRVAFANAAAAALLGDDPLALQGRTFHDVVHRGGSPAHAAASCPLLQPAHDGRPRRGEDAFSRAGGDRVAVEYAVSAVAGGRLVAIGIAFHDVAQRLRTDERLRHAERMEAVAQLAAGVAHDFNNLLAVILSCASALQRELPDGEASRDADEIVRAAQRGATLVRQLLDFGRRAPEGARLLEPNALLLSVEGMLRRAAGDRVRLSLSLDPGAGRVRVDPGSLEQALLALVLNARDAQPAGGAVEISTAVVEGGAALGGRRWVAIAVRDHGPDLSGEAKARLFEPFFTSREAGGGLGLATVHAFARQSGGEVEVESAPGGGTLVRLHLPEVKEGDRGVPLVAGWAELRGSETVLLLDEDPALRGFARQLLAELGYSVLEAESAEEAAAFARDHAGPVHLLVIHVEAPGEAALALAAGLRRRRPEMRVLYAPDDASGPALARARVPHAATLARPYDPQELLARVRSVLGGAAA